MRTWLLGLTAGLLALALPMLPVLGPMQHLGIAAAGCLAAAARSLRLVSGLLFGFAWGAHSNHALLDARLPDCVATADRDVLVEILDDPQRPGRHSALSSVRFRGLVRQEVAAGAVAQARSGEARCAPVEGARLRLAWYQPDDPDAFRRGQLWRLRVRLKPPWGYQNPGGFDFERWLLGERLQGTGYVRRGELLAPAPGSATGSLRHRLRQALNAEHLASGGILYALVSGDGSAVPAHLWERFRATGTIHLMVVSGLHVGLVAALGCWLGAWLVRLAPPLLLWLPARQAGAVTGIVSAACFVVFTGSGVPAQRALCMTGVVLLAVMAGRRVRVPDLLLTAVAVVLLLDPVAVHQQGLWLSFGAVLALILFFTGLQQPGAPWRGIWNTQLALFIGLTPLLALLQGQVPVIGAVANMLVVPVISVVVIPLALFSALLVTPAPETAGFGFYLADGVLGLLLRLLDGLADVQALHIVASPWFAALALAGAGLLLIGGSWRSRVVLALLWLCWSIASDSGLAAGEFRITALDVGQGSSILVDTRNHRLLFDAGPRFPSGFDLGAAVVVPSIGATGVPRLDVMVVSHPDVDHSGGAASVRKALPVARVFESIRAAGSEICRAGVTWQWDGVNFRFLSPPAGAADSGDNDASCVLHIANARERVLLPGDIGAVVERRLLRNMRPVRLLFAPHHGSNTSSSRAFVRAADPEVVFVSAGRDNRYGHPHPAVVGRYRERGAVVQVTGNSGALQWESAQPERVLRHRADERAYWTTP